MKQFRLGKTVGISSECQPFPAHVQISKEFLMRMNCIFTDMDFFQMWNEFSMPLEEFSDKRSGNEIVEACSGTLAGN